MSEPQAEPIRDPNPETREQTRRLWLMRLGIFALLLVILREMAPMIFWLLNVLSPFIIALIIAYVLHPIVTVIQRRLHLGRLGGMLVLFLALLLVLSAVVLWIAPVLYHQVRGLITTLQTSIPDKLNELAARSSDKGDLMGTVTGLARDWIQKVQDWLQSSAGNATASGAAAATGPPPVAAPVAGSFEAVRGVAQGVWHGLAAVLGFFASIAALVLILVITAYYLLEMDKIPHIIRHALPLRYRERVWDVLIKINHAVGGFLRGQLIACLGVGLLTTALLFMVGLGQYALLIGVVAGVFHIVPYLGPIVGTVPAVLWVVCSDQFANWSLRGERLGFIALGFIVIHLIDGFIFQPYIVGKHAQLHPLAVLLALAIGVEAGLGGLALAVPVACACKVLWIELYWRRLPEDTMPKIQAK